MPTLPVSHMVFGLALLISGCAARGVDKRRSFPGPRPESAVDSILTAFDRHPLVALGELHGNEDVHDVILALVRDPRFAGKVSDLVVEFGNSRYLAVVDKFLAGGGVTIERMR